ncbi:MAG: 3-dehydroquinate synthase [Chloroflexi bacterium]|nr:3-dehydroquinate synthase [Chloroflexota bacterium]
MGDKAAGNIILTGFSYTGKTKVGHEVAKKLGWKFFDTDEEIVRLSGKPIAEIFARDGEDRFRELETKVLERICQGTKLVISTGGGAIMNKANRRLMMDSGVIVCLEAKPATIYKRMLKDAEDPTNKEVRPLLSGQEPLKRIEWLKQFRQPYYSQADWTVHTDNLTLEEVADEVILGWRYGNRGRAELPVLPDSRETEAPYCEQSGAACVVTTATESYPVFVGWGFLEQLGRRMRNAGLWGRAHIISDNGVFPLYGERVKKILEASDFVVDSFVIPHGERSKSFETAVGIYDWLVANRAERSDNIVALGGGVVGDLAGFVAATFVRGMPLVQVPTSLIGMVDSSIGGKVGVNHSRGKNLIGAFYQPRLVVADTQALATLPYRELTSGWAEVIKHAMIRDANLLETLERKVGGLLKLEGGITSEVVARSAVIKAKIVSEDEKERSIRIILNYGHTIAHALEAATDYERFLHGEAVSIGMMGAAMISRQMGLVFQELVDRQQNLLRRFGLPVTCTDIDMERLLQAVELDKKVAGKKVRWVLLSAVGQPVIRDNVPQETAAGVIQKLIHSSPLTGEAR